MIFPPKEKIELTPQEISEEIGYSVSTAFDHIASEKIKEFIEERGGNPDEVNWRLYNNFEAEVIKEIKKRWLD